LKNSKYVINQKRELRNIECFAWCLMKVILQIITNYNMTSLSGSTYKERKSLAVINDCVQFGIFHVTYDLSLLGILTFIKHHAKHSIFLQLGVI
jgi:hypothetical protein